MKQFNIQISDSAYLDISEATNYVSIELGNPYAADKLLTEFYKAASLLSSFPYIHPIIDDYYMQSNSLRYFRVGNYLAFYRIDESAATVTIDRFLYGRSNWEEII
ncbi:MAG: type II toxin-antitoxin system RelE/ParE family toxin [Oscillospiraceae bacterium]|nr:type II toxin-antitoxin system RelE/ParE family toxin [Candidatus Limimonas egerieequi]